MTESDIALIAWNAPSRLWVFDPADPEPGATASDRARTGHDPIEAMALAMPADPAGREAALIGEVHRPAFDRRHVFVVGFSHGAWSCWQFSAQPPCDENLIRRCQAETPQAAMIACFEALGGLRFRTVQ